MPKKVDADPIRLDTAKRYIDNKGCEGPSTKAILCYCLKPDVYHFKPVVFSRTLPAEVHTLRYVGAHTPIDYMGETREERGCWYVLAGFHYGKYVPDCFGLHCADAVLLDNGKVLQAHSNVFGECVPSEDFDKMVIGGEELFSDETFVGCKTVNVYPNEWFARRPKRFPYSVWKVGAFFSDWRRNRNVQEAGTVEK